MNTRLGRRSLVLGALGAGALALARRVRLAGGDAAAPGSGAERLADGRSLVCGAALAFGTVVSITAVHHDPDAARAAIDEALGAVRRIDALMTVFRPASEVGRLNASGALLRPDPHLVRVLEFSQRLASLSGGAFDPTVQPLWSLFVSRRELGRLPSREELARARALVDWTRLEVSPRRVALGRGMAITLNGIAQGYATDLAVAALRERGIGDALVDAGELGAAGARQPGQPWIVGLPHPRAPDVLLATLPMDGRFLATSADSATSFDAEHVHHHVFDPRTGVSPPGLSAVAVAAASGMVADALTKPVMVLERRGAQALLARFEGAGAVWVGKDGRIEASTGMELAPAGASIRSDERRTT